MIINYEEAYIRLASRILGQNKNIHDNLMKVASKDMKMMYEGAEMMNDELTNMVKDLNAQIENWKDSQKDQQ